MKARFALIAAIFTIAAFSPSSAAPPIEAYGEVPNISALDISPGGNRFAYLAHQEDGDYFLVAAPGEGIIGAANTSDVKGRRVMFATENHAIVVASETARSVYVRGKWENSAAFAYDVTTKKLTPLLRGYRDLYPQSGLGRIVGKKQGEDVVFMPAFTGAITGSPIYSLLKVPLDSTGASIVARGLNDTMDWIVDKDGVVLVREDYDEERDLHTIWAGRNGDLKKIYEEETPELTLLLLGALPNGSGLVIERRLEGEEFSSLAALGFDGSISAPMFQRDDASIGNVLMDENRGVIGVEYTGLRPSYEFFDARLTNDTKAVASMFPDDAAILVSWSQDFSKLVVLIEGGRTSPGYFLFDRAKRTISRMASRYAGIKDEDVNQIVTIEYAASDGLKIPALLTLPRDKPAGEKRPMIVMPHGGPAAYDSVGFDWMAQYFASRGYLVFQPNFRGSRGFGTAHREAGYGEWGGKMQDDITDGVNLLIKKGWADPDRICIIGSSYGGYAALAGGAYTPDLYKCVAAVAPVTDLNWMLTFEKREHGADSSVYAYWTKLIGDKRKEKAKIEAVSPVNAAANFNAPVLLIHGADDTVVPIGQSTRMEDALKDAGKDVTFIKLKEGDHWLLKSKTRLQTLRELDKFVEQTIGQKTAAASSGRL